MKHIYKGVDLADLRLSTLAGTPLAGIHVHGDFLCNHNRLTNLIGGPGIVDGRYNCYMNGLLTLEGAAVEVGDFNCSRNRIKNLVGSPKRVEQDFICSYNHLESIEGGPEYIGGDFYGWGIGPWSVLDIKEAMDIQGNIFISGSTHERMGDYLP